MTENQMMKYDGKRVVIVMRTFRHSIATIVLRGIVRSEEVANLYFRGGELKKKMHRDFWVMPIPPDIRPGTCITWSNVDLITEVFEY